METDIRKRLINLFKPGKIGRRKAITLEDLLGEDLLPIERDKELFKQLLNWHNQYINNYLVLPKNFFPQVEERERRKRIIELKFNRKKTRTKRYSIENRVIPHRLFEESIEKIRVAVDENKKYSFFGYSWHYGEKNNLLYTIEIIEGYLISNNAENLIEIAMYFDKPSIENLINIDEFERFVKEYKIYKKRRSIKEIGGLIAGKVPSRTRERDYDVWLFSVPLACRENYGYAVWLSLSKLCSCNAEGWHKINYIRPRNEMLFCAHSIALYVRAFNESRRIFLIPFPKPTEKLFILYKNLRKNVFIDTDKGRKPLSKAQIELLLNRAISLSVVDLF